MQQTQEGKIMSAFTTQRLLLPALITSLTLSGCASMQGGAGDQAVIEGRILKKWNNRGQTTV
jgi:hypothetical protein